MTYSLLQTDPSHRRRLLPLTLVAALLLATVSGCAQQSSSPEAYNGTREWGGCAVIGAVAGAAIGFGVGLGVTTMVGHHNRSGGTSTSVCQTGGAIPVGQITCTVVGIPGQTVPVKTQNDSSARTLEWIGALGAIPGAIIGAIVGHYLCDPIFTSPYTPHGYSPPPPPPPSPGAESSSPPPVQ